MDEMFLLFHECTITVTPVSRGYSCEFAIALNQDIRFVAYNVVIAKFSNKI